MSQAGVVTVKGMADGREVEARVEILAIANELPTVKRVAPGTDLSAVDKYVSIAVTDGSVQEYEVDKWEIAEEDKAVSNSGSRIQATGHLEGQPIHATLVVEEGNPAWLCSTKCNCWWRICHWSYYSKSNAISNSCLRCILARSVASAENDVTVVQASAANGMRASIYVQPKDGGPLQTYAIQFLEEAPKLTT